MFSLKSKYATFLVFTSLVLFNVRCSFIQDTNRVSCDSYSAKIKTTPQYKKDTSLLSYTVYEWIDRGYGWFGQYNKKNAPNGFYRVHIGDVFYDSAKLKFTAFIFVEYNLAYIDTTLEKFENIESNFFDSYTIMGYRDTVSQPLKLFNLDEIFKGIRSRSLKNAQDYHASVFLNKNEMDGKKSIGVYDEKTGLNTKSRPVKYLPCEKEFWTESPLWKKGERVPGYYVFETYMNATPLKKEIRPVLKIDYPDSLLRL